MATKEEKAKQRYEYEIRCFIHEKMQSGKKEEQIIEALKNEKNINREDAIFFIDRLKNSDTEDSDSNNIVWGTICFVGGGTLALVSYHIATTDKQGYIFASVLTIYGAYRLLRGILGKIKRETKSFLKKTIIILWKMP